MPHVHHQHRLRGWTLSTETGAPLLLAGSAAPVLVLDRNMHVGGASVPGTSDVRGRLPASSASVSPSAERVHAESERFVSV